MAFKDTLQKWFGTAKETAADLTEKARPHVDKAVEATKEAAEKAKETANDLSEKAQPHIERARDKAAEVAAGVREGAEEGRSAAAEALDEDDESEESSG